MPALRRRPLPKPEEIPWGELRRRSSIVFLWLQAGWNALSARGIARPVGIEYGGANEVAVPSAAIMLTVPDE